MTKAQFIASVEAKPNFLKWAQPPILKETVGDIEKWHSVVYIAMPDGTNLFNVWFLVDNKTGEAAWQNFDGVEPEKNVAGVKSDALRAYLKANFNAYFIENNKIDLTNNWALATVYTSSAGKLLQKTVLVFKQGANPVSHLDVTTA